MATQRERSATARRRILDATQRLVSEGGVAAAPMGAIGESAGMGRGSPNLHFGSKDELLAALLHRIGRDIAERALRAPAPVTTPRGRLQVCLDRVIEDLPALRAGVLLAYEGLGSSPVLLGTINAHRNDATEHLMGHCELDRRAAELVLASCAGILLQDFRQPSADELQDALGVALDLLI